MCVFFSESSLNYLCTLNNTDKHTSEMISFSKENFSFLCVFVYSFFYLHCMVPPIMPRCRNLQPFFSLSVFLILFLWVGFIYLSFFVVVVIVTTKLPMVFFIFRCEFTAHCLLPMCCLCCCERHCLCRFLTHTIRLSTVACVDTRKKFAKRAIYTTRNNTL